MKTWKLIVLMLCCSMIGVCGTDVYSHIIDEDRRNNAILFEEAFYGKKNVDPEMRATATGNTVQVPKSHSFSYLGTSQLL